jgi:hypothetical protein
MVGFTLSSDEEKAYSTGLLVDLFWPCKHKVEGDPLDTLDTVRHEVVNFHFESSPPAFRPEINVTLN